MASVLRCEARNHPCDTGDLGSMAVRKVASFPCGSKAQIVMNKSASGVVEDSHTRSLSGPANVISFFMGALRNARPSPFASKLALASCSGVADSRDKLAKLRCSGVQLVKRIGHFVSGSQLFIESSVARIETSTRGSDSQPLATIRAGVPLAGEDIRVGAVGTAVLMIVVEKALSGKWKCALEHGPLSAS